MADEGQLGIFQHPDQAEHHARHPDHRHVGIRDQPEGQRPAHGRHHEEQREQGQPEDAQRHQPQPEERAAIHQQMRHRPVQERIAEHVPLGLRRNRAAGQHVVEPRRIERELGVGVPPEALRQDPRIRQLEDDLDRDEHRRQRQHGLFVAGLNGRQGGKLEHSFSGVAGGAAARVLTDPQGRPIRPIKQRTLKGKRT